MPEFHLPDHIVLLDRLWQAGARTKDGLRPYVESSDRLRWKVLLPNLLPVLSDARKQKEQELKARGVRKYKNMMIHQF